MTARELLVMLLRRWYLVLLGAAVSVGGLYLATHQPGVYFTQFNVVLLAPTEATYPNKIEDPRYALAPMAGLLAAEWNDVHRPLFTATGDTTLFGEGMRRGVQVRVPNQGTQWQPVYYTPSVNVQVVDSSPEQVEQAAREVQDQLNAQLVRSQDELGIRPALRVTTISAPAVPTIEYVSGHRTRTAGATALVGVVLTVVGIYWIERLLLRRRSRRALLDAGVAD